MHSGLDHVGQHGALLVVGRAAAGELDEHRADLSWVRGLRYAAQVGASAGRLAVRREVEHERVRPLLAQPLHRRGRARGVGQHDLDPGAGQVSQVGLGTGEQVLKRASHLAQRPGHRSGQFGRPDLPRAVDLGQRDRLGLPPLRERERER